MHKTCTVVCYCIVLVNVVLTLLKEPPFCGQLRSCSIKTDRNLKHASEAKNGYFLALFPLLTVLQIKVV